MVGTTRLFDKVFSYSGSDDFSVLSFNLPYTVRHKLSNWCRVQKYTYYLHMYPLLYNRGGCRIALNLNWETKGTTIYTKGPITAGASSPLAPPLNPSRVTIDLNQK